MKLSISFLLVLSALGSVGTAAQAPDWSAYRDSLRSVTDVAALHRLQGRLPMPGLATTPDPLVERGLVGLRVWELTGDLVDAEMAEEVFARGVDRFPDVVWMQYGLALANAAKSESQRSNPQGMTVGASIAEILRRDPASRARAAAMTVLDLDPTMSDAAVLIADLAVEDRRDRDALLEARSLLESMRSSGHGTDRVSRALSDVETALGNYPEAERALADVRATDGSGRHARAVALLLQPGQEEAGARSYFDAVANIDEAGAARLYQDVLPIATTNEVADWVAADQLAAKRLWFERFWSRRAAESGVSEADRLAEHYRRLALARREFLRNSLRGGLDGPGVLLGAAWEDRSPFDDRGLVLLKRGLPHSIVHTRVDGTLPNETWVYPGLDGGNQMFHFVALRGARDYSLVIDLLQALDPQIDPIADKTRFDRAVITLIQDRAAYEPRYQSLAARLPSELATLRGARIIDATEVRSVIRTMVEGVDADYRRDARVALATDAYSAGFDRALPFHFDLFTFRAPFGRTDLTAAVAVPAELTAAVEEDGHLVYPLAVSVILIDTLTDEVMRRDTVFRVAPGHALGAGDFVRAYVTMPVVPSDHTVYRMVARSPAIGAGAVYAGETRLKDYTGLGLQLSDLVLATPDGNGGWSRGDLRLDVTLPRRFLPGRPFTLFYEIYNIETDAPYRTHLVVERVGGGGIFGGIKRLFGMGGPKVDLRFEDAAAPGPDQAVRELRDLGTDLPPGRYRMRITVSNQATGETAESETLFEVTG